MSEIGAPMMVETLRKLERGEITPRAQDNSQASYAPSIKKEEGLIDWELPASQIYNRIRAFDPWPGTYTRFRGRLCHIWGRPAKSSSGAKKAQCGAILQHGQTVLVACGQNSWLELESVRPEGRKRVTPAEFVNGARLTSDDRFTSH
jgi:methionyl-tRNA formyltransferase